MNDCVRYERALKKELRCSNSAKKRLITQFQNTQKNFLEDNPDADFAALQVAFGPPEEMATVLMADTTGEERAQYKKQKQIKMVFAGVFAAAFLAGVIWLCFAKSQPVEHNNDIIDYGTLPSSTPTD